MFVEQLISDAIANALDKIEVSFVAEILTFSRQSMTAKIRPLLLYRADDGIELVPDIDNVPVELIYAGGAYIRPDYATGDLVRVSCYGSSLREPLEKKRASMNDIKHVLANCTVTSGIVPTGHTVPSEWAAKSGLLIGRSGNYIRISESGIEIKGNLNLDGKLIATDDIETPKRIRSTSLAGGVSAVSALGTIQLTTHTHLSSAPGSPTSPPQP